MAPSWKGGLPARVSRVRIPLPPPYLILSCYDVCVKQIDYKIIEAGPEWADTYRHFCHQAYLATYVRPELGITKAMFSEEAFNLPRIVKYFKDALNTSPNHKVWLAINHNDEILGGVVAYLFPDCCQMQTFYVRPDLKGHGIGHELYEKVVEFASSLPIQVDVVKYNQATIDMYKHWGFEIDRSKGEVEYDWVEWPDEARQAYKGIYMIKPGTKIP
jgi:GNAT superfamily N-acetyltransferase